MSDDNHPWNPAIVAACRVCGAPVKTSTDGFLAGVACSQDAEHHWWEARPRPEHPLPMRASRSLARNGPRP